eukprot:CAMPEP_0181327034 /NCGR_PEP_ID=MMETSP1101-20121128/21857_1 /TAXON_ID=46948 /ORGANISM="Rhodomonas abbreviata, Strain Caron Lab Isolate" /LENGTH=211 /DNA_ID=CAMNT_0023435609 /DNA_START=8 /DNA_END=643 /DNA_ORIENTATION=+
MVSVAHGLRPLVAALSLTAFALALAAVITSTRQTNQAASMLEIVKEPMLFGGYDSVKDEDIFDGRCRCTGHKGDDHSKQRVVCACTDKDDLWRKGPWKVVTGYTVVYDKHDEDPHEMGKYLTVVAQGFPDGPKEDAHYYLLIQPYDDFGKPTMPDLLPDGKLGIPDDGFLAFDTTDSHDYLAFKDQQQQQLRFTNPYQVISKYPELAPLYK